MTTWSYLTRRILVPAAIGFGILGSGCVRQDDSTTAAQSASAIPQSAAQSSAERPPEAGSAPAAVAERPTGPSTTSSATMAALAQATPAAAPEPERLVNPFPRPEDVPLAKMGQEIGWSPVTQSPGYTPGNDPEADAVRTGRRKAKVIDRPLTGGMPSGEHLAQYILDALRADDRKAMDDIQVSFDEFSEIMWPEFPQSRPYCNSSAQDAYFFLDSTCHQGISLGLSRWGGQDLELEGIAYSGGKSVYTNFTLYHEIQLHVRARDGGDPQVLRFVRTFAERKGSWKVYAYKDRE